MTSAEFKKEVQRVMQASAPKVLELAYMLKGLEELKNENYSQRDDPSYGVGVLATSILTGLTEVMTRLQDDTPDRYSVAEWKKHLKSQTETPE